jgi:hypothetical protein
MHLSWVSTKHALARVPQKDFPQPTSGHTLRTVFILGSSVVNELDASTSDAAAAAGWGSVGPVNGTEAET